MSKKNKPDSRGFVFSTDPNFKFEEEHHSDETLLPAQQKLKVRLDTKHRAGKAVTLVEGFIGKEEDLEDLGKKLNILMAKSLSYGSRSFVFIRGDVSAVCPKFLNQKKNHG